MNESDDSLSRVTQEAIARLDAITAEAIARMDARAAETVAKLDAMAAEMEDARRVGRDSIYRVALLSAAIVGFSATLLSIESVSGRVDFSLLRVSWFLFAGVVALGPLLIFVESRAKYAITWRAANPQNFDPQPFNALDRLKFAGVLVYTLAMRPRNLIMPATPTPRIRRRRGSTPD